MKIFLNTRRRAALLVLVGLAALPLAGCSYNKFVSQEEAVKAQWAQVQNQLQRRNDLIPNLVETVKGYATHEESVYKDIADAALRPDTAELRAWMTASSVSRSCFMYPFTVSTRFGMRS